ncbi:MAG: VRR-NUC domain-containing protein [Candidatus Nanohaloarchaea archaeon]
MDLHHAGAAGPNQDRSDITTALASCFPVLGGHGLDRLLEEPVWDHIKEHRAEQLSAYSQRALRNGENGRAFEERFEAFCEANALDCWKRSKAAFRRHLPGRFEQVAEQVDSFAGIPDYFVDKKNTHALSAWMDGIGERAWAPDGRYAFVECKFNASHLSPEQREMVQTLQDVGVAVYLFRGTLDDFEVRRVD